MDLELPLASAESIAIFILCAADLAWPSNRINFEDCVLRTINVGVEAEAEEMLVIVRIDARIYLGAPAVRIFTRVHGIGVQNTSELDLKLDRAVLVEDPVDAVLVVCGREDV